MVKQQRTIEHSDVECACGGGTVPGISRTKRGLYDPFCSANEKIINRQCLLYFSVYTHNFTPLRRTLCKKYVHY